MRITIGDGSGARQVNLKIMPVCVREFDLEEGRRSTKVAGGTAFNARFRLNGPAPAGFVVALSSSDPSVVVPSAVAVLFGSNESPNFEVSTMNVLETKNVTITGTPSAGAEPGLVQVGPRRISQFTLDSITSLGALGGSPVTGRITLDSPVQGSAFVVPLSSSSPAATVPASITIPVGTTGGVGGGDFTINTTTADADVPVTITAGEGETAMFAQLTVRALAVDQIRVSQDNAPGGSQVGASVTLNFAAPAGGFTVPLSSSDPQVASVPSSVTVLQGHMDASFNVSTSEVTADASVTITAGQGATAKMDNFTVENK